MPNPIRILGSDSCAPSQGQSTKLAFKDLRGARILLAVYHTGNRARILEQLRDHFEILEPETDMGAMEFDLAIVDASGLAHWQVALKDYKLRSEPTFLPTLLILPRNDLNHHARSYWDLIDEFIVAPIDRVEFQERMLMLLRTRHLAKTQKAQLAYLATHDRVSGLPNQQRFMETLTETILDASVLSQTFRVIVIKFNVSRIMSSLGHKGLDKAAIMCTTRLKAIIGHEVACARLTTETWGLIDSSDSSLESVLALCNRLKTVVDAPLHIDGERIHHEIDIGVGTYPDDASDATRLLDCAINALGNSHDEQPKFYSKDVQHAALKYIRTETRLREALDREQFQLWYQPQIDTHDMSVSGVEALVRWRLPSGHFAPPGDFLSVAEATGLIVPLDRWVLRQACMDMARWRQDKLGIKRVAVNVTADDVQEEDFVDFVRSQLAQFELPPPTVELELTESTLFETDDRNLRKLNELRGFGLDIAIDDFGTGYSSLSYLHKLPINILKIDQCFIRNILTKETDDAITKTIIWLAKNFNLRTIAEGVETAEQAKYIKELGVDTIQGYYYAKPMPEKEFRIWLENWSYNSLESWVKENG